MKNKKAVVLLSGGLDSSTVLYIAKDKGYDCRCVTFDYGQRHVRELDCARAVARAAGYPLDIVKLELPWGGSSLLDSNCDIPVREIEDMHGIPSTYVPARNTIFLSFALSCAEATGADTVFIGANQLDYSGYPDCRAEYFESWEAVMRNGTKRGVEGNPVEICVPLLNMNKKDIIQTGISLGVPYELTWSCYRGAESPCRQCDSCKLREKAFEMLGMIDPLLKRV